LRDRSATPIRPGQYKPSFGRRKPRRFVGAETNPPGILKTGVIVLTLLLLWQSHAKADAVLTAVTAVERDLNARVGFYLHDLQGGGHRAYNADLRFALNSTFKLFACAALLSQVEAGVSRLSQTVDLRDLKRVTYSPAVDASIAAGRFEVSLDVLCRMMLSVSDNTAANAVLAEIGGPEGFTAFMRSIGDDITRLDRWETALNEAAPDDPRDTTTPRAIATSLERLLLGDALTQESKDALQDWLSGHVVAAALFRASLPPDWRIADRTGAGGYGSRGMVAVMYPPGRQPIVAVFFIRDTEASMDERNAAAAEIAHAIVEEALTE
jgi:beta-lactamase class A/beta-lactamase class A CARB-5